MTNAKNVAMPQANGEITEMPSLEAMQAAIQQRQEVAAEEFKVKYEQLCEETGFQITGFPATTPTGDNLFGIIVQLQVSPIKAKEKEND